MPPEIAHMLTKPMKAQTESTHPVLNNTEYISKLKKKLN